MWRSLSKYVCVFFLLALSGLFFLINNINVLEQNLNCQTVSTLYQLQSSIHTAFFSEAPFPLDRNHSYCGLLGQEPSPEEALEERYLLESIAWPEPMHHSESVSLDHTSDPAHSFFVILPARGRSEWYVGDQLEVFVQMYDFQGQPKGHGGDFLLARLHSSELEAGVAGQVLDHRNGTYSAIFPLLWQGSAQVEMTLVHPSEAVHVLRRLREERPDRVFFKSLFRSGKLSQTTVCNLCLPTSQKPLCNYTDAHTEEPWYCYKPKLLSCDTRINHATGGYVKGLLTNKEALLFQSGVNIKVHIHPSGSDSVTVLPEKKDKADMERSSMKMEPTRITPSGYYFQGSWRALTGGVIRQFNDSSAITQCLKGKLVYMYGDSTVRQWFEYLNDLLPEMKQFNLHSPKNVGPNMAVDSTHNILLRYHCHGPPIRFTNVIASEMRYVANELDGLTGGSNTVVFISIWSHFSTFPVQVYIRRLRHIRRAMVRLLDRAPGTMVVLRSANLQALDPKVSLYNSDWYSLQLDGVLRAMFRGLDILLIDAWEMTLGHHLPHALHPPPIIIKNMIDIILSRICP
ncbi:NXPE family member 3-like isoform X1 [Oncorhynchus keta]|uniref:NXPE family member 3-like isoform X1 n=1 Tax=Oncorhynchus keta TaxID=8018 RepID=UPI0015FA252A|nr:NXPE family member 3-like isoform X1 [Oncorhynchus keta]XP_035644934.1 NXPE family member 3-like isoform X1 [Oncorhynchus keta]